MALSLAGTWMAAKKYVENWLIWIFADILYVGIYLYKDSYLTAILYTIFVVLAIAGYREWKKDLQKTTA
jgi:nicotinamide mononucleotide transporter